MLSKDQITAKGGTILWGLFSHWKLVITSSKRLPCVQLQGEQGSVEFFV